MGDSNSYSPLHRNIDRNDPTEPPRLDSKLKASRCGIHSHNIAAAHVLLVPYLPTYLSIGGIGIFLPPSTHSLQVIADGRRGPIYWVF